MNVTPKPGAAHQRLDVFVGTWKTEGQQFDGMVGPATNVIATDAYAWMTGGMFLVHRFEGYIGRDEVASIAMIGHDAGTSSYPVHAYYNTGLRHEWKYQVEGPIWVLTGSFPIAGEPTSVRCTVVMADDGKSLAATWEHAKNAGWQVFWELQSWRVA